MEDIEKLVQESKRTPEGFKPPTFEFDGHTFEVAAGNWSLAVVLDMAYRARHENIHGHLRKLLTDLNISIIAVDGRSYWPMEG